MIPSTRDEPVRLLMVRLTALGDVLFTLPALTAIKDRYPDAIVDWVVEDKAQALIEHEPAIRRLVVYPRRDLDRALSSPVAFFRALKSLFHHIRELRRERYDAVLDFQGNLKSAAHVVIARGKKRIGYGRGFSKEGSHRVLNVRLEPPEDVVHRVDRAVFMTKALGCETVPRILPPFLPDSERAAIREHVPVGEGALIILHPGTSAFGAFKRWAPERFGELARELSDHQPCRILVTWGPGEEELARRVVESSSGTASLSKPTRSLLQLGAILEQARLFVGADSGPLHLASFLGVSVLALFGPKDPAIYGPRNVDSRVVRSAIPCSPCTRRRCPDALCMEEIRVSVVAREARALLADHRSEKSASSTNSHSK